jgi:hypothetical protein
MAWFARDHTKRQLTALERSFLEALAGLLSQFQPAQIDEDETALTAERDTCLIALIPHRALGGISLGVWLTSTRAQVFFAQVGGLGVNHDSLDLGPSVDGVQLDAAKPDFAPALECVRRQLLAPLTIKLYGPDQATVYVRDRRGRLRYIGDLGAPLGWFERRFRRKPTSEAQIRFVDDTPPPITEPSGADEWFLTKAPRGIRRS